MAATEQYFNPVATLISGDVGMDTTDLTVTVTDASLFPVPPLPYRIIIDLELMMVTGLVGNVFTVVRGIEGTTVTTHQGGATVQNIISAGALGALFVAQ